MTSIDFSSDYHRGGSKAAHQSDELKLAQLQEQRERLLSDCTSPLGRAARVLSSLVDSSDLGMNRAATNYVKNRMNARKHLD